LLAVPDHFWGTFVAATADGARTTAMPLLGISPFLVLLPLGVWVVLRAGRLRGFHITMIIVTLSLAVLYLSFVAGGGGDLRFHNARYWTPYYPYWVMLSVIGARWVLVAAQRLDARRRRRKSPESVVGYTPVHQPSVGEDDPR
jgi:hypothetical protein